MILVVFCVVNMLVHVLFLEERDGTAVFVVGYVSHEVTCLEKSALLLRRLARFLINDIGCLQP